MVFSVYDKTGQKRTPMNRGAAGDENPNSLPFISQNLDSVRTYQWEFQLDLPADFGQGNIGGAVGSVVSAAIGALDSSNQRRITLAAKQITGFGYNFADIEVHRVNDKVFYPGKISQDELVVTFDNLLGNPMSKIFYEYLASVYDMRTGHYSGGNVGSYKTSARILEFNGGGDIQTVVDLKGLYPKSFTKGEKNYSTSEFDTMEVKFRWDFMNISTAGQASLGKNFGA